MKKSELRQAAILEYMRSVISQKGVPPTIREICEALNIKSTSTVHKDIEVLKQQGFICKDASKPRTAYPKDMLNAPKDSSKQVDLGTSNDDKFYISENDAVAIPVVGRVAAGTPILAEENIDDSIVMPSRFIGPGNNFILTVHGDSMVNVGINDGDYIIVQECNEAHNGEIIVAMIDGDFDCESTVKTFYKENGHIRLQPENDYMDPIIVDDCKIVGRVRGVFRYYN